MKTIDVPQEVLDIDAQIEVVDADIERLDVLAVEITNYEPIAGEIEKAKQQLRAKRSVFEAKQYADLYKHYVKEKKKDRA